MALTKLSTALNIIQGLSDRPNQTDGLTAAQMKAKFDEAVELIQDYINDTLTVEADNTFATKSALESAVFGGIAPGTPGYFLRTKPDGSAVEYAQASTPTDIANTVSAIDTKLLNKDRLNSMGGI